MSSRQNLYTGRSGQLAVMAQFLMRGYNVAMPEVDVGEDIFVVRDSNGKLWRIQVKAAVGKGKQRVGGAFKVSLAQLTIRRDPDLFYVFTMYHDGRWREFVILPREALKSAAEEQGLGHAVGTDQLFYLSFTREDVQCSGISLAVYRDNWTRWPVIQH
jgi:hypothetical protein